MDEERNFNKNIKADYDTLGDILTYSFTQEPQPAIAEEAADDVWVRFDPESKKVITIDFLNFSSRLESIFGSSMKYSERNDPELISKSIFLDSDSFKKNTKEIVMHNSF